MTKYGKITEGVLHIMPWNAVHVLDGETISTTDPKKLLRLGYKRIVYNHPPDPVEGYYLESEWIERNEEIVQNWRLVEQPIDNTPTIEERIEALESAMLEALEVLLNG